ncbi:MAG: hypothetical protein JNN01_19015, partial [Opitutaceae bacterium]|nr:hypothetical protein [Opitutaceae bacterium]
MLVSASSTPPAPDSSRPLLPAVLSRPSALLWFWTLPIGILLALNLQGYTLIEGNMNADQRQCAHQIGAALVANLAGSLLGYALLLGARRRRVDPWIQSPLCGIPIVIFQVAYLWLATTSTSSVMPASVTRWIYPEDRFLFNQFAFAMPPLFLGLFWLATLRAATQSART